MEVNSELVLDVSKVLEGTCNVQSVPLAVIAEQVNISSSCSSPPASSLLNNRATVVVGDLFTSLVDTATLFSGLSLSKVLFSANSSPSEDNVSSAAFGWLSLPDALLDEAVAFVSIANSLLGAALSSLLAITKEFQCASSLASDSDSSVLDCNNLESFLLANLLGVLGVSLANSGPGGANLLFEGVALLCGGNLPGAFLHWSSFDDVEELALLGLKDALVVDAFLVVVATLLSQQSGGTVVLLDSLKWNISANNVSLEGSPRSSECTNLTNGLADLASALSLFLAAELSFLLVLVVLSPGARNSGVLGNLWSNKSTALGETLADVVLANGLGCTSVFLQDTLSTRSSRNFDLEGNGGTSSNSSASWLGFLALEALGNVWIAGLWLSVDADLLLGTSKGSLSLLCTSTRLLDLVVDLVDLVDCSGKCTCLLEFLASWSVTLFDP